MDLITQILAALVIILALALYNRTQSTTTATTPTLSDSSKGKVDSSNTKKANKKKKKSNSKSATTTTTQESSQATTNNKSSKKETSIQSQPHNDDRSGQNEIPISKPITENPSSRYSILNSMPSPQEQASPSNKSNGSSSKTNDQRREEINKKKVGKGEERVADMIDRDIQPETTYERVARIPAPETTSQSNGFGPNDYEEWEQLPVEDQGGWESVGQGSKSSRLQSSLASTSKTNPSSNGVSSYASNNPFSALPDGGDSSWAPVGRNGAAKSLKVPSSGNGAVKSLNGSGSSNGGGARVAQNVVNSEPTKKQRQNAAKAAAKKAQKEAEEKERLERLAKHKKEVEGERIKEFYSKGSGSKPTSKSNGGPRASVNQNGALVWD